MLKKAGRNFNPKGKSPAAMPENQRRIESTLEHTPVWQLKNLDMDDPAWGWKNLKNSDLVDVLEKLKHYESMLWKEIFSNQSRDHSVRFDKLASEAQKRLIARKLDDIDELFRLRLNGKQRIWGILDGYVFKILWWDPDHTVCPSVLKYT